MKKTLVMLAVMCMAFQPLSAQKPGTGSAELNYYKALEMYNDNQPVGDVMQALNDNVKEYPGHIESYVFLRYLYMEQDQFASAIRIVDTALENNHKSSGYSDATLMTMKSSTYYFLEEYETAAKIQEAAVKSARKNDKENLPDIMDNLGEYLYQLEDYDGSDQVYEDILKIDPTYKIAMVGLARNMNARKQYDDALVLLEKCRKYSPDYENIYVTMADAYEGKGEYRNMIDAMVALFEISEDLDDLSVERMMKDKKYALAVLKEKSADDDFGWLASMMKLYESCHMYDSALRTIDRMIFVYGEYDVLLDKKARLFNEMGMSEFALATVERLLEIGKPRDVAFNRFTRGVYLQDACDFEGSIKDFDAFIERYPTDTRGYYMRGWSRLYMRDYEAALEDFNAGLAVDEAIELYCIRGEVYLLLNDLEKAKADFEKVLTFKSDGENDKINIAYALQRLGRDQEAIEVMDDVLSGVAPKPGSWYSKASILVRMGKYDDAISMIEMALKKGYRNFANIENDYDMDPLRDRADYKAIIEKYKAVLVDEILRFTQVNGEPAVEPVVTDVAMTRQFGGTYEIPCTVNGLPLKMIFDTGASDVTISSVEASFMLKNGYLTSDDVKGRTQYLTASGDIHEGTILRLKEVKLGDAVLRNVEASVVHNQQAPLLLGQSVLERFGTITIDNVNSRLLIKQ